MINIVRILGVTFLLIFSFDSLSFAQVSKEDYGDFYEKIAVQKSREPHNYFEFTKEFVQAFNTDIDSKMPSLISEELLLERKDKVLGFLKFMKNDHGDIHRLFFKYFDFRNQREKTEKLAVYTLEFKDGSFWELRLGINENQKIKRYIITDNNYNESEPLVRVKEELKLPFHSDQKWYVLWGGLTHEDNYHVNARSQKNAIDFLIKDPDTGKTFMNEGKNNSDYYAFGKPILSPTNGTVVKVIDSIKDNTPGEMNRKALTGNTVIIKTQNEEYLLLAHFQEGTIAVKEGQVISAGDFLGKSGNSGNSSEPHLHIQAMTDISMKEGLGLEMVFEEVTKNGVKQPRYRAEKGDYLTVE